MNLIQYLLEKFVKDEWINATGMLIASILLTIVHSAGISTVISKMITMLQNKNLAGTTNMFKWFVGVSIAYVVMNHIYKIFQTNLLTKLRQWMRQQLINILMIINNSDFSDINFTKMQSPINRVSTTMFMMVNDWLSYIFPNIMFLFLMSIYFLYTNPLIGCIFVGSIILQIAYTWLTIGSLSNYNKIYEDNVNETENYMQEILNNMGKIIARGQVNHEMDNFEVKTNKTIESAYDFYNSGDNHGTVMNLIASSTMFIITWMLITKYYKNKESITNVITFITILILYRENMETLIKQIPNTVEFIGRMETVIKRFGHVDLSKLDNHDYSDSKVEPIEFIKFDNVTFKYKNADKPIIKNLNLDIRTQGGKIVGIRGPSGCGKSTLGKLIVGMHQPNSGKISGASSRCSVTYVDQSGSLFDESLKKNLLYGCGVSVESYLELSKKWLNEVMKGKVWSQGLSGGERQALNVLSGLMQESRVLILDEPTNALDPELKKEVLKVIVEYKKKKDTIIIISHDKEVFGLFDETIML